jgi:hypothetical protein
VHRTGLHDRGTGSGQPAEPLPQRTVGERALRAGSLEGRQCGTDRGHVRAGGEREEPRLVERDLRPQIPERLGVDNYADVDQLAALHPGHDADKRILEHLAHSRVTSGTSGARLSNWAT